MCILVAIHAFLNCSIQEEDYNTWQVLSENLIFLGGMLFMRIRNILCLTVLTLVIVTSKQVLAEGADNSGPYVKLYGGINSARDSDFNGSSEAFPSGEASLDMGSLFGFAAGYRFNEEFSAELDYSYRNNDIDKIEGSTGSRVANGGDLASVAIMANGLYHFDFAQGWTPYLGLGIGFLQEIDADVELVGLSEQSELEDEVFAWQAMVGVEVPLGKTWKVFGEGRFMTAPGPELSNSDGSYDIDYENLSLHLGVGYQF